MVSKTANGSSTYSLADLEAAGVVIKQVIQKDATRVPPLETALVPPASGNTSSGAYSELVTESWTPFYIKRSLPIPEALFEQITGVPATCSMGLFPQIDRAWIALNNQLYLWDYVRGIEFLRYEEQPYSISSCALVPPKPGVFIDEIQRVLVLSTKATLQLIGLSRDVATGELKMYNTDMVVETDGNEMTSIVGTTDGRVFMTGIDDGCLYELLYQAEEGWFSKRVRLENRSVGPLNRLIPGVLGTRHNDPIVSLLYDPERSYLHTYAREGALHTYTLKSGQFTPLFHIPSLHHAIQFALPVSATGKRHTIDRVSFGVASMHAVPLSESRSICLVMVSFSGLRIYLSDTSSYGSGAMFNTAGTTNLRVAHIRFPPGTDAQLPGEVLNADYLAGSFVCAYSDDPTKDTSPVFFAAVDVGRLVKAQESAQPPQQQQPQGMYGGMGMGYGYAAPRPPMHEWAVTPRIAGRPWAIDHLPLQKQTTATATSALHVLATQFVQPPEQFLVLTNQGLNFFVRKRPVDVLRMTLERGEGVGPAGGQNRGGVGAFAEAFGRDETCASLLALAARNTYLGADASDPAAYSSSALSPGALLSNTGLLEASLDVKLTHIAKQALWERCGKPVWVERGGFGGDPQGSVLFSGKREGFALYFARLVRPIWGSRVTVVNPAGRQESTFSDVDLVRVQRNLQLLLAFLEANLSIWQDIGRTGSAMEQEAWKAEVASFEQLYMLLSQTIEAISFVLLLVDYKIGDVVAGCDKQTQDTIATLTYSDLITTARGRDTARALLNTVINQQISYQISVDAISEILQQRCGSFCSADDVMQYKAMENLKRAKETPPKSKERILCLREAIRLFEKGIRNMSLDKLREIAADFRSLGWAQGAVELPLQCALAWDGENLAAEWGPPGPASPDIPSTSLVLHMGGRDQTTQLRRVWEGRMQCYDLVLESLKAFDELVQKATAENEVRERVAERDEAFGIALSSTDRMWHSRLYDWMIEKGLTDALLQLKTPFVEEHLQQEPIVRKRLDLLWEYYVKHEMFLRAAVVLCRLAETPDLPLTLREREEYLTWSVANARGHAGSPYGHTESAVGFLTDVEEKLEVAKVQRELLDEVGHLMARLQEASIDLNTQSGWGGYDRLQDGLLSVSEMYQNYAEPLVMHKMKLLLFHVSDYRAEGLIISTWEAVFADVRDKYSSHGGDEEAAALDKTVSELVQKFYPSDVALPLDVISLMLEQYALEKQGTIMQGWAPRVLLKGGVPPAEIFNVYRQMYESQVPPFNNQANVQFVSSDIAILLHDWVTETLRPQSTFSKHEFPVGLVDSTVDTYIRELLPSNTRTLELYTAVKNLIRQNW